MMRSVGIVDGLERRRDVAKSMAAERTGMKGSTQEIDHSNTHTIEQVDSVYVGVSSPVDRKNLLAGYIAHSWFLLS